MVSSMESAPASPPPPPFSELKDRLESARTPEEVADICADIRKSLKGEAHLGCLIVQGEPFLSAALMSSSMPIRELAFDVLKELLTVDNGKSFVLQHFGVCIAELLDDSSTQIAAKAEGVAAMMGGELLVGDATAEALRNVMEKDATRRMRVLSICVAAAHSDNRFFTGELAVRWLGEATKISNNEDILLLMNKLQLMEQLADVDGFVSFLEAQGTLAVLPSIHQNDALAESLLLPAAVRLVGKLFQHASEDSASVLQRHPFFSWLGDIISPLTEFEEGSRDAAITAISNIAKNNLGLSSLLSGAIPSLYSSFGALASQGSPSLLKMGCLKAIAEIIANGSDDETHQFYMGVSPEIDGSILGSCMDTLRGTIPDMRYRAFDILLSMTRHGWGVERLLQYAGVVSYLLDRSTEISFEGKKWKMSINRSILAHADIIAQEVGQAGVMQFERYVRQGVAHVLTESAVQIDDETV